MEDPIQRDGFNSSFLARSQRTNGRENLRSFGGLETFFPRVDGRTWFFFFFPNLHYATAKAPLRLQTVIRDDHQSSSSGVSAACGQRRSRRVGTRRRLSFGTVCVGRSVCRYLQTCRYLRLPPTLLRVDITRGRENKQSNQSCCCKHAATFSEGV